MKTTLSMILLVTALLTLSPSARAERLQVKGGHELGVSGVLSRSSGTPPFRGWLGGFTLSYGYFITDWLQPEVQGQFDVGDLRDANVIGGGVLAGVNVYYNHFTRFLPFGGVHFGVGFLQNNLSGREVLNTTGTLAPKVGVLFLVKEWLGVTAAFEYQHVFVPANSFPDLNLVRFPVGVFFLF